MLLRHGVLHGSPSDPISLRSLKAVADELEVPDEEADS